jgi:hypothetical protein
MTDSWASIVTKGFSSYRLIRNNNTSALSFHFNSPSGEIQANGSTDVMDNQWHHVVAVYDGSSLRLYVDGRIDAAAWAPAEVNVNTEPVFIAGRSDRATTYGRNWIGQIDDVRIYDTALDEAGILFLAETSQEIPNPRSTDLVTDGLIDTQDLSTFLQAWLTDSYWP